MKILIAEDDLTTRTMLQAVLTRWGYHVTGTGSGVDAFGALRRSDAPDLAILDWEMPGMDGPEVCRRLRGTFREKPLYLILLTARGESGDIVQGLEAGADDYIAKPYDNAELKARINVGCRIVALQKEMRERERLQGVLEMAGAVCHELNQPLQSLSGYSELLLMDLGADDPDLPVLVNIKESVDRIGELTRKIMKVTRYQSKPYLQRAIVDIEESSRNDEGDLR